MEGDKLVGFVTFLLVLTTIASIYTAYKLGKDQDTQRKASEDRQRAYEQKANFFQMWQYISAISEIDQTDPITSDVVTAVNTLEFVALCVSFKIVDKTIVMRTFRDRYMTTYRQIEGCGPLKGFTNPTKNGRQLLIENRAAREFFDELEKYDLTRDAPST